MRPEKLTELTRKRPFSPLRLHLTDGTTFDIRHPDQIIVLRGRIDVGIKPDPQTGVVESVEHVSLLHLVRVEELGPASSPKRSSIVEGIAGEAGYDELEEK